MRRHHLLLLFLIAMIGETDAQCKPYSLQTVPGKPNNQVTMSFGFNHPQLELFSLPDSLMEDTGCECTVIQNNLSYHLTSLFVDSSAYVWDLPTLICANDNQNWIAFDRDRNYTFADHEYVKKGNDPDVFDTYLNYEHHQDSLLNLSIPVRAAYFSSHRFPLGLGVDYRHRYQKEIQLGHQSFTVTAFPYVGVPRFFLEKENDRSAYFFYETFQVDSVYWKIAEFDYVGKTIQFDSLGRLDQPLGFRAGFYLDSATFYTDLDSLKFGQLDVEKIKSADYILLHFWGDWCHPCLEEMPRFKKIAAQLENKNVAIVNVAFLMHRRNPELTFQYIRENNIPGVHVCDASGKTPNSIIRLTNTMTYPGYMILDKSLQVLYNKVYDKTLLPEFLHSIGLL